MGFKFFKRSKKMIVHGRFKIALDRPEWVAEMDAARQLYEIDITQAHNFSSWATARLDHVMVSASLAVVSRNPTNATSNSEKEQAHLWPWYFDDDLIINGVQGHWIPDTMPIMAKQNWPTDIGSAHNSAMAWCEIHEGKVRFDVAFPTNVMNKPGLRVDSAIAIEGVGINTMLNPDKFVGLEEFETQSEWWQDQFPS